MVELEVEVAEWEVVVPSEETPKHTLWLSDLDQMAVRAYTPLLYYYRPSGNPGFFSVKALKAALSKVLVPFYPLAGQLVRGRDGRIEINCTGEGALFVVARCRSTLDELGEVVPSKETAELLVPSAGAGDPRCMLMKFQVTFFKCGGVCFGVATHHSVMDGAAMGYFMGTWADVARGGKVTVPPYFDRTVVRSRSPPSIRFDHIDYTNKLHGGPSARNETFETAVLRLSRDQVHMLKSRLGGTRRVSTFIAVAAHLWRCACKARRLTGNQETRLYTAVNFRNRLVPPLKPGFLGIAIARVSAAATVGELLSSPMELGGAKISDALARMDDEFLRSLLDHIGQQERVERLMRGSWASRPGDFWITSWLGLRLGDLDLGWGKPVFMVRGSIQMPGLMYIVPSQSNEGGVTLFVGFEPETMPRFKKILYDDLENDMGGNPNRRPSGHLPSLL